MCSEHMNIKCDLIFFLGKKQIWNLQPFSAKDFQILGLAERINDLPQLHFLYPDIPKQAAFARFMTQTSKWAKSVVQCRVIG